MPLLEQQGDGKMGFKNMESNLTFMDIGLMTSIEKNRAIKRMEQINTHVRWKRIEAIIMKDYPVGNCKELFRQFAAKGLVINEGVAVDARLVQSASRPISKDKLESERQIRESSAQDKGKDGNNSKFSRDVESDWTIKNNKPHFGLKEHAAIDVRYGFLLATHISPASHHDSRYLPLCVSSSCHNAAEIKAVYADKGYFGEPNRSFLVMQGIGDGIIKKGLRGKQLTDCEVVRNKFILFKPLKPNYDRLRKEKFIFSPFCLTNITLFHSATLKY